MKQEPEHYGFPETHYKDHGLQTINDNSIYSVITEYFPHRENTVSKINSRSEDIDSTEILNLVDTKVVSNNK